MPDADIRCVSFYEGFETDYAKEPEIIGLNEHYFCRTQFPNKTSFKPEVDSRIEKVKSSGEGSSLNSSFFVEGYNFIFDKTHDYSDKVLMLAEDHFFTTGETLKDLQSKNFNVAYARWDALESVNASIIAIKPSAVKHLFPIPYGSSRVEDHLKEHLIKKSSGVYQILSRNHRNYRDGYYTNDIAVIEDHLRAAKII